MAEERKTPVEPSAPVEPRTRRGARKMDDVAVEAARGKVRARNASDAAKIKARTKTALMAEQEKQAEVKARARAKTIKKWKARAGAFGRNAVVIGPIVAPMAIAWTGQSGFAMKILGWNFLASLLYAAAYELTTVFAARMYHEAKKDGDKGWEYRAATWAFAIGAGVQQWWHYSEDWAATPRSVTYSTMTAIGVLVWELHARLIHRRALRAEGKITKARPSVGLARWVRYPRISWAAWSGSVRYGFESFQDMWQWAEIERERARTSKDKVRTLRKELKEAKALIADLQKANPDRVIVAEIERVSTPDPEPTPDAPEEPKIGPQVDRKELEAGPLPVRPTPGSGLGPDPVGDEFQPTEAEVRALRLMAEAGLNFNRENVASFIRENREDLGQDGIATARASLVAKWGRENADQVKEAV